MTRLIDNSIPAGGEARSLGDDRIRALKIALQEIFGIPNNVVVGQVAEVVAAGLKSFTFSDAAANPATTGRLQRSGAALKFHDGTAVRTVALLEKVYPVGSIYISTLSTNPATLMGFGTWAAFATGRTLVGLGAFPFDSPESVGGEAEHTLTVTEIPQHTHPVSDPGHAHSLPNGAFLTYNVASGTADVVGGNNVTTFGATQAANANITVGNNPAGGGAHNNLPPYIVVYMWKRTA